MAGAFLTPPSVGLRPDEARRQLGPGPPGAQSPHVPAALRSRGANVGPRGLNARRLNAHSSSPHSQRKANCSPNCEAKSSQAPSIHRRRPRFSGISRQSTTSVESATSEAPPSPPSPRATRRHVLSLLPLASLSAALWGAASPPEARAENVRLEDVESRELQAALEAAVSGDLVEAEARFSQLIEAQPESASMWSNRGSVRLGLGKFQEAAEDFSQAVSLAPYAAVPFLNRAIAYEALGRYDEAADDCYQAIKNDPHESAAFFNLGNIEMKRGKYQQALDAYESAADLAPGIAGYRLREATTLFQVGFGPDAERLVRSIVRKYPNYAEAHAALAGMLWGEGSLSLAEEQLTEALDFEPNFRNFRWVDDHVEWPPKLLQSYKSFLALK